MSQYHVVETKFKDQECLVQALKDSGYEPQVNDQGMQVSPDHRVSKTAHVVVSRSQFGGYGDVGFEKTKEGFIMHYDNTDWSESSGRRPFDLSKVRINYNKAVVRKAIRQTSKYTEISCEKLKDGREKMRLRVWEF